MLHLFLCRCSCLRLFIASCIFLILSFHLHLYISAGILNYNYVVLHHIYFIEVFVSEVAFQLLFYIKSTAVVAHCTAVAYCTWWSHLHQDGKIWENKYILCLKSTYQVQSTYCIYILTNEFLVFLKCFYRKSHLLDVKSE